MSPSPRPASQGVFPVQLEGYATCLTPLIHNFRLYLLLTIAALLLFTTVGDAQVRGRQIAADEELAIGFNVGVYGGRARVTLAWSSWNTTMTLNAWCWAPGTQGDAAAIHVTSQTSADRLIRAEGPTVPANSSCWAWISTDNATRFNFAAEATFILTTQYEQ